MLSLFREDLERHEIGSACYFDDTEDAMYFCVKRFGTKESKQQCKDISDRLYGVFPKPSDVDEDEIFANWLAYFGVVDWGNVIDDENGTQEPFSESFRAKLFLNKRYWLSINKALIIHATDYNNYIHAEADEDLETLKKK